MAARGRQLSLWASRTSWTPARRASAATIAVTHTSASRCPTPGCVLAKSQAAPNAGGGEQQRAKFPRPHRCPQRRRPRRPMLSVSQVSSPLSLQDGAEPIGARGELGRGTSRKPTLLIVWSLCDIQLTNRRVGGAGGVARVSGCRRRWYLIPGKMGNVEVSPT